MDMMNGSLERKGGEPHGERREAQHALFSRPTRTRRDETAGGRKEGSRVMRGNRILAIYWRQADGSSVRRRTGGE